MRLTQEECRVINQDRELELLRHCINWHSDYQAGLIESAPPTTQTMEQLQADYLRLTGCYWDPVNAVDWKPATDVIPTPISEQTDQALLQPCEQSPFGRMWGELEPLLSKMPHQFGIETMDQLLYVLEAIQILNSGLTDDEVWLYEMLIQRWDSMKAEQLAKEIEDDLADQTYELQHPLNLDDVDWEDEYEQRQAAHEYKYDGR